MNKITTYAEFEAAILVSQNRAAVHRNVQEQVYSEAGEFKLHPALKKMLELNKPIITPIDTACEDGLRYHLLRMEFEDEVLVMKIMLATDRALANVFMSQVTAMASKQYVCDVKRAYGIA